MYGDIYRVVGLDIQSGFFPRPDYSGLIVIGHLNTVKGEDSKLKLKGFGERKTPKAPDDYYFVTPVESPEDALQKLNSPEAKAGYAFCGWTGGTAPKGKIQMSVAENLGNCLKNIE